jgi:DNA (cytosine-5)-methyltransferase 1
VKVIDFFCGCGGLSLGFEMAGFDIQCGIDNDETAAKTFESNHKSSTFLPRDINDQSLKNEIDEVLKGKKITGIVGGPPCQGFSLTGPRNFKDPRNALYLKYWEFIRDYSPDFFVIENVPGIAGLYGGKVREDIIERFSSLSYKVTDNLVLVADYGVPQLRRRMFFVGFKESFGKFEFPKPTRDDSNYVSCEDAIGDLPSREKSLGQEEDEYSMKPLSVYQKLMRKGSSGLFNHVATKHTDLVKSVIRQVPEGGNHKDLPPGVGESRKFNEAWTRYHSQKPSRTIDTGHRNHFHYKWDRVPTIRENARLQSFPDKFRFWGTKTQQNRQVGNAVPPLFAKILASHILNHLNT